MAVADPVTDYLPSARPGSRAPHVWLQRAGERLSTIDLFGPYFVLLTGRDGDAWREAARRADLPSWPSLRVHAIGEGGDLTDPDGDWHEAYGVEAAGAVLVRAATATSRGAASQALQIRIGSRKEAPDGAFGRSGTRPTKESRRLGDDSVIVASGGRG